MPSRSRWIGVERPRLNHDAFGPPHVHPQPGQAQAALLLHGRPAWATQRGIDEDELLPLATSSRSVHDEYAVGERDLIGSQADPFCRIHDLEHLLDGLADGVVDPQKRLGPTQQRRVRVFDELQRPDGSSGG